VVVNPRRLRTHRALLQRCASVTQPLPRPDHQPDPLAVTVAHARELVDHILGGAKRTAPKVGLEFEAWPVDRTTGGPVDFLGSRGIQTVLLQLAARFGHTPIHDGEHVVALARVGGGLVSLEPGGQVELSATPVVDLKDAQRQVDQHLQQLREVALELDLAFVASGCRVLERSSAVPTVPKSRYAVMTPHLAAHGGRGLDMMRLTATVQANVDFSSETDLGDSLQVALGVGGLVTALTASSPFFEGAPSGLQSERMHIWHAVDPARTGLLRFALEQRATARDYVEHALGVPLVFVRRGQRYLAPPAGLTFGAWLHHPPADLGAPTLADFEDLLSTLFFDVRLKRYLETRTADVGPPDHILAVGALWKGLLYNAQARAHAWSLVSGLDFPGHCALRLACARDGLGAKAAGVDVRAAALELCLAAQKGLVDQGAPQEAAMVGPLAERARTGRTLSDDLLAHPGSPLDAVLAFCRVA